MIIYGIIIIMSFLYVWDIGICMVVILSFFDTLVFNFTFVNS